MRRILRFSAVFVAALAFLPTAASASTVLPARILPPGPAACPQIVISEMQVQAPGGVMQSFEFTVSDPSYVSIAANVGDVFVPFYYMTRSINPDGSLRMHVTLPSSPKGTNVPIQVTMLSAQKDASGQAITCAYTVPGTVTLPPAPTKPTQPGTTPVQPSGNTGGPSSTTTKPGESENPGIVAATHSLGNLCVAGGASRLWIVLLVLYVIFVATLLAQKYDATLRTREWNIALILAGFIGLLLFWYISAICRAGPWAPAIATCIALAGLVASMLMRQKEGETLLLQKPKK